MQHRLTFSRTVRGWQLQDTYISPRINATPDVKKKMSQVTNLQMYIYMTQKSQQA